MYRSIGIPLDEHNRRTSTLVGRTLAQILGADVTGLQTQKNAGDAAKLERLASMLPGSKAPSAQTQSADANAPENLEVKSLEGRPYTALTKEIATGGYDLVVLDAKLGEANPNQAVSSLVNRLIRNGRTDALVIKETNEQEESDTILVCIDGSAQSFAGLKAAIELGRHFDKKIECVGVYDPYLHYTLFNGIVNVLSKEASSVFKFADQEKLHEEIIDTGLARIYQAHLEVAREVAKEMEADIDLTLLDGKAFQKILRHVQRNRPWLLVLGRIGVHSGTNQEMDIGATAENLLRTAPCSVLVTSQTHVPRIDLQADAAVEWTPDAKKKMERVPDFVRGVATTAILRWSVERGHSVITPSVINSAMGDLLPPDAAQAMGYVAEELAIQKDNLMEGTTFICPDCGHSIRDIRPTACSVCKTDGARFEKIDRAAIEAIGRLEKGALTEEDAFDGKRLTWTSGAKEVLRRVPSGYQRRRSKARIEKTARVRGIFTLTQEFAIDMVEQDLAETSYLSKRGESLDIDVKSEERPDDSISLPREDSEYLWTAAAWKRMCRVPEGFMRNMTRKEVELVASDRNVKEINLQLCEDGLAEGRRIMAETLAERSRKMAENRAHKAAKNP
jgi:nucleotide-binding universal stress UspA family protein